MQPQQQTIVASRNSVSNLQRETSPTVCCLSTGGKFQFLTNQEIEKKSNFSDRKDERQQQQQQRGVKEERVKSDNYYTKSDYLVKSCKNRLNGRKVSSIGLAGVEKVKLDEHISSGSEVKKVKKREQDNTRSKKVSCSRDEIGRFGRQSTNNNHHHHLHENCKIFNIINRTTTITRTSEVSTKKNQAVSREKNDPDAASEKNIHQRNKLVYDDDGKNSQSQYCTDNNNNRIVKISDYSLIPQQTKACSEIKNKSVIKQSASLLLHDNDFSFIDSSSRSVSRSSSASYDSVNRQQRKYHIPNVSDVQEFSVETCANQNIYYSPVGYKDDFRFTDDDDVVDVGNVELENGPLKLVVDQSTSHENNPVSLELFTSFKLLKSSFNLFILNMAQ